jgi:hypothetical protein
MITNFNTPSLAPTGSTGGSGKSDKTIMFIALLLGGFLLYKFVIKPEMDKQKQVVIDESSTNGEFE